MANLQIPHTYLFFPAKLLLFGEYSIVTGGQGLAIPLPDFGGILSSARTNVWRRSPEISSSNDMLRGFCEYLQNLQENNALSCGFDLNKFQTEVRQGLYFNSTIPQGYGLGSSGALTAAVYKNYALNPFVCSNEGVEPVDFAMLRDVFAEMEAFFHGKSSGIDPLVSYLNFPLLIQSADRIAQISLSKVVRRNLSFFLYDTHQKRPSDSGLVPLFVNKMKQPDFSLRCKENLNRYNNHCIAALLNNDESLLFENAVLLSEFQLNNFLEMIPVSMLPLWEKGLAGKRYVLKLCGAGGGGYVLGITPDFQGIVEELGRNNVKEIEIGGR
ncbi:MAG: mevalonate kinase [Sphingobacteriales bacterium]|nr:MAG: mevalonate kinase [Sphingobacteriales bacterium]